MNETLYKVTDADGKTFKTTQWGAGVTNRVKYPHSSFTAQMCTSDVIHAHRSLLLAGLMWHVYLVGIGDERVWGTTKEPVRFWRAEGEVVAEQGMSVGCRELTTVEEIAAPKIANTAQKAFGVLSALAAPCGETWDHPRQQQRIEWEVWARTWLAGHNRDDEAASTYAHQCGKLCHHDRTRRNGLADPLHGRAMCCAVLATLGKGWWQRMASRVALDQMQAISFHNILRSAEARELAAVERAKTKGQEATSIQKTFFGSMSRMDTLAPIDFAALARQAVEIGASEDSTGRPG